MLQVECQQIGAYLTEVETVDENTWLTTTFLPPAADTGTVFSKSITRKMHLRIAFNILDRYKSTM